MVVTCDAPGVCEDDNICDTSTGQCEPVFTAASSGCDDSDGNACTTAGCDGAGTCDQDHMVVQCPLVDGQECLECDTSDGTCVDIVPTPQVCEPGNEICRTPGFWGARGGTEKSPRSQNITQAVIDSVTPPGLDVCGVFITNTDLLAFLDHD